MPVAAKSFMDFLAANYVTGYQLRSWTQQDADASGMRLIPEQREMSTPHFLTRATQRTNQTILKPHMKEVGYGNTWQDAE